MAQDEIAIAVELPTTLEAEFREVAQSLAEGRTVTTKLEVAGRSQKRLDFDPFSAAVAVGWIVLKVTGAAAEGIAAKIMVEMIYNRLKAKKELQQKAVRFRFPDGTIYDLVVDDPHSKDRLQQLIAEKARS